MRTLFFDIDGTLLVTQRAGGQALARAMREEFGISEVPIERIQFGGRTDRDLVREFLVSSQLEASAENEGRLRRRYASLLRETLSSVRGEVLPGVVELLGALSELPELSLAVMTGNFPETARMKLEAYRLMDFFAWIVGGDLDRARCDMARRAVQQLVRRSGQQAGENLIVIGDTAHDIRCARTIGARCLAVCTGTASRDELQACQPDHLVDSLADASVLDFLVR
jgi:phosphoglycolate phosphatase